MLALVYQNNKAATTVRRILLLKKDKFGARRQEEKVLKCFLYLGIHIPHLMAVISYKKYNFQVPALINNDVYNRLKEAVTKQAGFRIYVPTESFGGHFKKTLTLLLYLFPLFAAVLGYMLYHGTPAAPLPGWWIVLIIVMLITGFISVIMLVSLLLQGPSYATYLYNKQQYYSAMQYAVQKSSDYHQFVVLFWGPGAARTANYKALAGEAAPAAKQPATFDGAVLWLFRMMDNYGWMVVIAVLAWLVWRHYHADK